MRPILVAVAAGAILLGACGGDDDDGSASGGQGDEYVDAVAASMSEDEETPLDAERANCAATAIVDVVGVDTLTDADISPDELGEADSLRSLDVELPDDVNERLGEALGQCDLAAELEGVMVASFSDEFGSELPEEAAACLRDNMDDQALVDAMAAAFVDGSGEQVQEALTPAIGQCPSVATAVLLAQAPTDLSPAAEACLTEFVEANPDLVARSFGSRDASAGQEMGVGLAAACPEVAAALGTRGG